MNSYTQHIIGKMTDARAEVIKMLGWSEGQYLEFQYKTGCQYLQAYIPQCPDEIDQLLCSRIFWSWWRNEWLFRDTAFIASDVMKVKAETQCRIYLGMNDADVLALEIYPGGVVLNSRYAGMIGNVQNATTCK